MCDKFQQRARRATWMVKLKKMWLSLFKQLMTRYARGVCKVSGKGSARGVSITSEEQNALCSRRCLLFKHNLNAFAHSSESMTKQEKLYISISSLPTEHSAYTVKIKPLRHDSIVKFGGGGSLLFFFASSLES